MRRAAGLFVLTGWFFSATLAGAEEPFYLPDREMKIPVTLPPAAKGEVEKLALFVSSDEGKTWRQEVTLPPSGEAVGMGFHYIAPTDGLYWFNVAYINRQGKMEPADIGAVPPQMKLVVDTQRPIVRVQTMDRQADQLTVQWEVRDANLDLDSLRLEYRPDESPTWRPLALPPKQTSGQKRFTVGTTGPVVVRMVARDKASNSGEMQVESAGLPTAASAIETSPTSMQTPGATVQQTNSLPQPEPPALAPPPPPGSMPPPVGVDPFRPASPSLPSVPAAAPPATPAGTPPTMVPTGATAPADAHSRAIASSLPGPSSVPTAAPTPSPSVGPRGPLPPLQYANQLRLELDYEIPRQGPSGISVVELWMTQDHGQSWTKLTEKTDPLPPFAFDVPGEGQYGFTLIVRSGAGLGRAAPQRGEYPELRVEVDTTPPAAQLFPVEADPRRRDYLFFNWKAEDKNLGATPISLFWSERREGPWHPIVTDHANTGRLPWKMPADLPYQIYLRLQTRDQAGNVCLAETSNPVLVDLTEPEVKIKGLITGARPPE
ncbi:MAG TPA: hypothetical protein PKC45_05275 [Gemmatales bacterium]|nr:hypothetical protein [Gemmatales bacterium]